MKKINVGMIAIALAAWVSASGEAQSLPPIRQLGPVTAVAKEPMGAVSAVRQLPDGRVLVNDIVGRRVVLFDSSLASFTLVADTTSATSNAYGARPGGLIAYRGDSTLFVDPASLSMLVLDANGKIVRVMSVPRPNDAQFIIGGPFGTPAFDAQGRLMYRAPPRIAFGGGAGFDLTRPPAIPDSAAIIRVDPATRKVDTLAWFKTPKFVMNVTKTPDGGIRVLPVINPLPQTDDWAILPDGTLALVRGRDFHIDFVDANKTITSAPKIPYEWQRLSDEDKVAYVDSARKAMEAQRASGQLGVFSGATVPRGASQAGGRDIVAVAGAAAGASAAPGAGVAPGAGATPGAGAAPSPGASTGASAAAGSPAPGAARDPFGGVQFQLTFVAPTELPDYKPPFTTGATRVDADGNLWVRTTQNVNAIPVYNVINRKGELIDRVQLPKNRTLIGFGPAGVVYLGVRDGTTSHLERARIR
jgi:hypothetical protein